MGPCEWPYFYPWKTGIPLQVMGTLKQHSRMLQEQYRMSPISSWGLGFRVSSMRYLESSGDFVSKLIIGVTGVNEVVNSPTY